MQIKDKLAVVVRRELLEATFFFVKFALFGYIFAVTLFYFMTSQDSATFELNFFIFIFAGLSSAAFLYVFTAERFIKSLLIRKGGLLLVVAALFLAQGISFREILPNLADEKIRLVAYCLMVGVTGAAAFVFTADKHIFPLLALVWNLPLMQYMLFQSRTLPEIILAAMLGIYLIVMAVVQRMEFGRREELIRTRLQVIEEKTATMAAKNLAHRTIEKQNGDYFLLRLLFEPLLRFRLPNGSANIETHLQQHKTFTFRDKSYSIGGDFIYVDELTLAGEKYTFATNADAMGKSVQGASGAIVYGVLINALIQRTKTRESESAKSPERWLKEAYHELDNIFSTFDGSMIVSAILMLIHESGTVFHINAEHPSLVLYRHGKCTQFSLENQLYKLGTRIMKDDFAVQVFRLETDDCLILASDGRDDILIVDKKSGGGNVMNHSIDIFGEALEAAAGNLNKCIEIMGMKGQFSDDLSIIMIRLPSDAGFESMLNLNTLIEEALKSSTDNLRELVQKYPHQIANNDTQLKRVMNFFIQHKTYEAGAQATTVLLKASPYSNRLLYYASYLARKAGKFEEAVEFGERLRHRDPNRLSNLINLCYAYIKTGNIKRARFMHQQASALQPENRHAKILAEALG